MKIEDINNPELKNHINMIYMHGENQNQEAIERTEKEIKPAPPWIHGGVFLRFGRNYAGSVV